MSRPTRERRSSAAAAPWRAAAALACLGALVCGACGRAPSEAAPATTGTRSAPPNTDPKPAPSPAAPTDPTVASVDGEPLPLSWVEARLRQAGGSATDGEAVAAALLAAAADRVCLREFAVLKLRPEPGERPHEAVDRLLAGTWPADHRCKVDLADLRVAYMGDPHRWHHPTGLVLWEARIACCDGDCGNAERDRCQQARAGDARALHKALSAAVPPPLAVTLSTLAASPAKARHVPAFEATLAGLPHDPSRKLLRYTAFAREPAFAKMRFRRTDPALERAVAALPLGALTAPVRTEWGWSVAMLVGRDPARPGGLRSPATRERVRVAVCTDRATAARVAYRTRMLRRALLRWNTGLIQARFGKAAVDALPPPSQRPRPALPQGLGSSN